MPELPEVETIRRQLIESVKGKKIKTVQVIYPKAVRLIKMNRFLVGLKNSKIIGVGRRAKLLLIHLSNKNTLIVHLKMTGRLLLKKDKDLPNKSTEVIFDLSGQRRLFYDDLRRFGYMKLVPTKELKKHFEKNEKYGPEVLEHSFTPAVFKTLLSKKTRSKIKPLLLDQKFIAGVGNIYAQEACYCAKIMPTRSAGSLSGGEINKLHGCLRKVLLKALECRGSSVDDYLDLYGRKGEHVVHLNVYGREGKNCPRCGAEIIKKTIGGRGTSYCPKCQI